MYKLYPVKFSFIFFGLWFKVNSKLLQNLQVEQWIGTRFLHIGQNFLPLWPFYAYTSWIIFWDFLLSDLESFDFVNFYKECYFFCIFKLVMSRSSKIEEIYLSFESFFFYFFTNLFFYSIDDILGLPLFLIYSYTLNFGAFLDIIF